MLLSDQKIAYIKSYIQPYNILDLGSGSCCYSEWIAKNFSCANVTAIDKIEAVSSKSFNFIKSDLENDLPLSNAMFETILAFDVIEHISNEEQFLFEIFRVCKPGGIFIGSVPHDQDLFLPKYNLTFFHRSDLTHKRYYTVQSLNNLLSLSGFNIVKIDFLGGVNPQVISEFFPSILRPIVKRVIGACRRLGLIDVTKLHSDLFFVASKK